MAITTTSVGTGLHRSGAYLSSRIAGQTWSVGFWYKAPSLPTGTNKYCLWHYGDVNHINPYIAIYHKSTGIYTEVFNGATTTTSTTSSQQTYIADTWIWISIVPLGTLNYYHNSRQFFTNSNDGHTLTFVETDEYLGTDLTSLGGASFAYFRDWSNFSSGQLNTSSVPIEKLEPAAITRSTSLLTETNLANASTLTDTSGNSRDWTAVGSITTLANGPLTLISGLFSDNFNQTNKFTEWNDVPNLANAALVGCGMTSAFGCSAAQIWKSFDPSYNDGSMRFMLWQYNPSTPALFQQIATVDAGAQAVQGFQLVLFAGGTGILRVRYIGASGTVNVDSSAGVIPTDGSPAAIQLNWNINGSNQAFDVYVNNVQVITQSGLAVSGINSSYRYWHRASINTTYSSTQIYFDNFELENSRVVEDWHLCTLNKIVSCASIVVVIPVPIVTDIIVECTTKNITIIGSNFPPNPTVILTRDGVPVEVTPVFSTDTIIVVNVPDFQNGKYCAYIKDTTLQTSDGFAIYTSDNETILVS